MTWKGTVRSIGAAARRAEREAARRKRELEKQRKQLERLQESERAAYEVEVYENQLDVLLSMHKECGESWNWEYLSTLLAPNEPQKSNQLENAAQSRLNIYKPSFKENLLRQVDTISNKLNNDIKDAKFKDEQIYNEKISEFKKAYKEWELIQNLSNKILDCDLQAYAEAIRQVDPFQEINQLGSSIEFDVINSHLVDVSFFVKSEDVIPTEVKTQLKSGKLSVKKMPKTRFFEIYQDFVCGCVLRIARELFALLPIKMTVISVIGRMLNTKTGYMEDQPILSVAIPRETLSGLNLDLLDPSDSMENFVHRMKFMKTKGFQQVEPLSRKDFPI